MMSSFLDVLRAGGWMMLPLGACSVGAVAIIIERARQFFGLNRSGAMLIKELRRALMLSDARETQAVVARAFETSGQGPLPDSLRAGWEAHQAGESLDGIEAAMEAAAQAAFLPLRRGLPVLDTIVTIAPLLGLLGTIAGMMGTFRGVALKAAQADTDASLITGGIGEALIATAFGIVIAVVSLVFLNLFNARLDDLIGETELRCTQLLRAFKAARREVLR